MVEIKIPQKLLDRRLRPPGKTTAQPLRALGTSSAFSSTCAAAMQYAGLGWAVLPLHSIRDGVCTCSKGTQCQTPGKHPIMWGGVHSATKDVGQITELWRANPDANIGIATGEVSGIVALDFDPRNGSDETTKRLVAEFGKFPWTVKAETGGGGTHRLYRYPDGETPTRHKLHDLPGLDLQSDGAYIVAAPSLHVSGERYRWAENCEPDHATPVELPAQWLARLRAVAKPLPAGKGSSPVGLIPEGGRNTQLTSLAGTLRRGGLSPEGLLAALKAENFERCRPPLSEEEVAAIAASIGAYPVGLSVSGDEAEGVMQTVLDRHYAGGRHLLHASDGQFWAFEKTHWCPIGKLVLKGIILQEIKSLGARRGQHTSTLMNQVLLLLEASSARPGDPLRFLSPPLRVINCRNGELWIGNDGSVELRKHDPASYLRNVIEADYDPGASCPHYDEAVLEIFGRSKDPEGMAQFWDELMGYAAQPNRRVPLIVAGWGGGNNGKTRLLETYVRLIGAKQIVAMPVGNIDKSRFSIGNLLGKLALIDDDVKSGTRLPDAELKSLSEEKTITGEHKYGNPFTFTSRTAIIMLFNNPPSLADLTYGMQRRLFVVPFDRRFTPEETKPELFDSIWATELAGVLNRYLAGLQRVIQRGWKFDPPAPVEEAKAKLLVAANPVPAFIEECCEESGASYVQPLYNAFGEWARNAGITMTQQRSSFQRNLESLGYKLGRGSQGPKIMGLKLRPKSVPAWPAPPQP